MDLPNYIKYGKLLDCGLCRYQRGEGANGDKIVMVRAHRHCKFHKYVLPSNRRMKADYVGRSFEVLEDDGVAYARESRV